MRELWEESGLRLATLDLAGYARFRLTGPPREEYAAMYSARVSVRFTGFTPNEEISAICWWDVANPPPADTQILDVKLAEYVRSGHG